MKLSTRTNQSREQDRCGGETIICIYTYIRDIVIYFGIILFFSLPPAHYVYYSIISNPPILYRYYQLFFFSARSLYNMQLHIMYAAVLPVRRFFPPTPRHADTRSIAADSTLYYYYYVVFVTILFVFIFFSSAFLVLRPTMITRASYLYRYIIIYSYTIL